MSSVLAKPIPVYAASSAIHQTVQPNLTIALQDSTAPVDGNVSRINEKIAQQFTFLPKPKHDQLIEDRRQLFLQQLVAVPVEDQVLFESNIKSELMQNRSHRGSRFRGVSKNGEKYQVMVISGSVRKYVGALVNEDAAGLIYDKYSIILQGMKVSIK